MPVSCIVEVSAESIACNWRKSPVPFEAIASGPDRKAYDNIAYGERDLLFKPLTAHQMRQCLGSCK